MPKSLDHTITRIPIDVQAMLASDAEAANRDAKRICYGLALGIALFTIIVKIL
ncbi:MULTISPECIES: hypothetical protein [Rhizobium/Agrobacterium group]|uniref:hypothetical protein n=1 Tax=Rhizobium/Agrobacterium group TaxID=227290 RepID=UPI0002F29F79|nr:MULTISPECIES: hypothetical protein [Rhizobium/Agrobacterium group]MUO30811.1 hypothetical protein [Agrobacterium vitis]